MFSSVRQCVGIVYNLQQAATASTLHHFIYFITVANHVSYFFSQSAYSAGLSYVLSLVTGLW